MPNGKIHAATTLAIASVGAPLLISAGDQPAAQAAAFTAGCLVGLVINPDLDVDHGSKSFAIVRETAGCLGVTLWKFFWWPYARLIPHRSPLSHWPVLGTAIRLGYFISLPLLIWWLASLWLPLPSISLPAFTPLCWWGVAGLVVVDTFHIIQDKL